MKYLGIDYGRSKVGFAFGNDKLATPHIVYKYENHFELIKKILDIIKEEHVKNIVVGISESKSAKEAKNFANMLETETNLPVELSDETLSTHDANSFAIEAGIGPGKRRRMEDAYAATIILQKYLDNL